MTAPQSGGVVVKIDPKEWYRFSQRLKQVDPRLVKQLRRRIRESGRIAVDKVIDKLGEPSPAGGPDDGARRAALAAATKVTVSFTARSAGAKVVTSASGLDAEHKGLAKVYNKERFRHPVFGQDDNWVEQEGNPYMGREFSDEMRRQVAFEINAAFQDAAQHLGRR